MTIKRHVDIEKLLHWAFQEELPKRSTSSAEGIWDRLAQYGSLGGINPDPGHGAAQRYAHFGLPHPDAEKVELAASALDDRQVDWANESGAILGAWAAIADTRPLSARPRRSTVIGYNDRHGDRLGWRKEPLAAPRDVIMVRSLRTAALVVMHAKMGTRPDWEEDEPRPGRTKAAKGPHPAIVGECHGRNVYSLGAYCPVTWDPSPISIAQSRADYLAWWRGLKHLAETLVLDEHEPTIPKAPEMPWDAPNAPQPTLHRGHPIKTRPLPLKPQRERAGPPPVRGKLTRVVSAA